MAEFQAQQQWEAPQQQQENIGFLLHVGGVSYNSTQADVEEFFADCGQVVSVRLPTHADSGRMKGYALVEMATEEGVNAALAKDGQYLGERYLRIRLYTAEKPPRRQRANNVNNYQEQGNMQYAQQPQQQQQQQQQPQQQENIGFVLHVGGVSFDSTPADVENFFAECGEVVSVRLPQAKNGRMKGFALVEMATEDGVNAAIAKDGQYLGERYLRIRLYTAEKPPRNNRPPRGNGAPRNAAPQEPTNTCYVGNLPWSATEQELIDFFAGCGTVVGARIALDRRTGRSKGFAHVEFEQTEASDKAVALSGALMEGREIRVDYAGPRRV